MIYQDRPSTGLTVRFTESSANIEKSEIENNESEKEENGSDTKTDSQTDSLTDSLTDKQKLTTNREKIAMAFSFMGET